MCVARAGAEKTRWRWEGRVAKEEERSRKIVGRRKRKRRRSRWHKWKVGKKRSVEEEEGSGRWKREGEEQRVSSMKMDGK